MPLLASQAPGTKCKVLRVDGIDPISQRLAEMGLVAGSEIEVVKLAPLGDPMQIGILGYQLTLRKAEARKVWVEP